MTTTKNQTAARPLTKSQLRQSLAERTGLSPKQVGSVLDTLAATCLTEVRRAGKFSVPGLCNVVRVRKPATKEKKGVNPFTKEPMVFKAKPARNVVRVRPVKALKEGV